MNVCFLLQRNKSEQHFLQKWRYRYRSYLCHTHFPLGCLSKHSVNYLDACLGQRLVYCVSQEFVKTRGPHVFIGPVITKQHTIIIYLIQNQLETQINFTGMLKMAKIKTTWGRNPSYKNFLYAFTYLNAVLNLKEMECNFCSIFLRSPFKESQEMAALLPF